MRALVTAATRHQSTAEIANAIAAGLARRGIDTKPARSMYCAHWGSEVERKACSVLTSIGGVGCPASGLTRCAV